jgi:hypothetical protein
MLQTQNIFCANDLSVYTEPNETALSLRSFSTRNYVTVVTADNLDLLAELEILKTLPSEAGPMNGKDFLTWLNKE